MSTRFRSKFYTQYDFDRLYCFYLVVESRSMKKAAQRMGIKLPTLSEKMKKFNNSFDQPLLIYNRSKKRTEPTEYGKAFYSRIRGPFSELEAFLEG